MHAPRAESSVAARTAYSTAGSTALTGSAMPSRSRRKSAPSMRSGSSRGVSLTGLELGEMVDRGLEQRVPHERRAADTAIGVA